MFVRVNMQYERSPFYSPQPGEVERHGGTPGIFGCGDGSSEFRGVVR